MKKIIIILLILALGAGVIWYLTNNNTTEDGTQPEQINIEELVEVNPVSHASFVMTLDRTVIYNDPVGDLELYSAYPPPDVVLLSDIDPDHLDVETLSELVNEDTPIIAPAAVAEQLPTNLSSEIIVLANGDTTKVQGVTVTAIPMYNTGSGDDVYHPEGRGNGYLLERSDARVYIAGDTEETPEMRDLEDIDVAFVPMNLPYTMSVEGAADAVLEFAPRVVYPYHYRGTDGLSDVEQFKTLVEQANAAIEVVLGDWYPEESTASETENDSDGENVTFDISGTNFAFDVTEMRVSEGDTVTVNFTSESGFHDWVVDEFGAATEQVDTGGTTSVTFVADRAGTYEYYCSVGSHRDRGMVGTLIVE